MFFYCVNVLVSFIKEQPGSYLDCYIQCICCNLTLWRMNDGVVLDKGLVKKMCDLGDRLQVKFPG